MKIGFDGKRATHNFRGLGNYSRGVIEGLLANSSHELFLFTPAYKDPRAIHWIQSCPSLNLVTPSSFIENTLPSFWRTFLLGHEINWKKIDIFHGLSHEIPNLPKSRSFRTVVTIHDLIFLRYPEYFTFIDRNIYLKKIKYAVNNADLIIAICEQTKNDLINFLDVNPEKIVVHYQSVPKLFLHEYDSCEISHFRANHGLDRPYILNVGAFEERKNQHGLIYAFHSIINQTECDLVLVGNGKEYLKKAKRLASDLKIENRVKFLTNFPYHSLPLIYQGAEMFVFPSFFEGFGIPIVESLFSKTPVLTSAGSCFPESAGPDSVYFNPHDYGQIANAILSLLADKSAARFRAEKSYIFAQKFTVEHSTSELLKHYSRLS